MPSLMDSPMLGASTSIDLPHIELVLKLRMRPNTEMCCRIVLLVGAESVIVLWQSACPRMGALPSPCEAVAALSTLLLLRNRQRAGSIDRVTLYECSSQLWTQVWACYGLRAESLM